MVAYASIPSTERDAYSPISQELLAKYYDRDEGLRERTCSLPNASGSIGGNGTVTLATYQIYYPIWAKRLAVIITGDRDEDPAFPSTSYFLLTIPGGGGDLWTPVPLTSTQHAITATVAAGTRGTEGAMLIVASSTGAGNPALYDVHLTSVDGMYFLQ